MIDLFLPNEESGFFGIVTHWLGIGFIFCFVLELPAIAGILLLLYFPALFLMMLLD